MKKFNILERPVFLQHNSFNGEKFYNATVVDLYMDQLFAVLDKAKVVFCTNRDSGESKHWTCSEKKHDIDTHKALLIDIQPIEKKECDQHNVIIDFKGQKGWFCSVCEKKLNPNWEVIND